jgi:spore coat polysaccharide biosynthesis protein SpsF
MLARQIEGLKRCRSIDRLLVATSTERSDAVIEVAQEEGVHVLRWVLEDVLDRYYQAATIHSPSHVVRLTADGPLAAPNLIDLVVQLVTKHGFEFASNCFVRTHPHGLDVEIMTFGTLGISWRDTTRPEDREHVTTLVYGNPKYFKLALFRFRRTSQSCGEQWTIRRTSITSSAFKKLFILLIRNLV